MVVAFKEWQVVCEALATGRQSIILRKGGIHEGKEGFSFAHQLFFLFPTKFHAQMDQVREGEFVEEREWQVGDVFQITHRAEVVFATTLTDWESVEALYPFHIYKAETLKDRFEWEGKGMTTGSIHVAFVRVFKLDESLEIIYEKRFGGCRSWLELSDTLGSAFGTSTPVLDSDVFEEITGQLSGICQA